MNVKNVKRCVLFLPNQTGRLLCWPNVWQSGTVVLCESTDHKVLFPQSHSAPADQSLLPEGSIRNYHEPRRQLKKKHMQMDIIHANYKSDQFDTHTFYHIRSETCTAVTVTRVYWAHFQNRPQRCRAFVNMAHVISNSRYFLSSSCLFACGFLWCFQLPRLL